MPRVFCGVGMMTFVPCLIFWESFFEHGRSELLTRVKFEENGAGLAGATICEAAKCNLDCI